MENRQTWKIIESNLAELVALMITVPKGAKVDVFCDPAGKKLSYPKPSGDASIKLCSVTTPDLGNYGLRPDGDAFVTDDGEKVANDRLVAYLTECTVNMKDGGAEWG